MTKDEWQAVLRSRSHENVLDAIACNISALYFVQTTSTGCFTKNSALSGNQTLGTSYSETTNLLDLKLWQQGVLMSTPCCQSLTSNRLIVSEYEVPNFLGSRECRIFYETPCSRPICTGNY